MITLNKSKLTINKGYLSLGLVSNLTYATLDPAKNSSYITLSNNNLTSSDNSTSTQSSMCLSTLGFTIGSSGTIHCEFTFTVVSGNVKFGLSTSATSLNAQPQNSDAYSWNLKPDGYWTNNVGFNSYTTSMTVGDIVGMDIDKATGNVSFSKNGTSLGYAFTVPAGTYYISTGFYQMSASVTVNFGATPFSSNPNNYQGLYN